MIVDLKPSFLLFLLGLALVLTAPVHAGSSKKMGSDQSGAVLFRDKGCTYCHGVGAVGTKKAPALTDLWKDKAWTDEKITSQILNGGQKMPPFSDSVTDDEVRDLIAYLRARKKPMPASADSPDAAASSVPQH